MVLISQFLISTQFTGKNFTEVMLNSNGLKGSRTGSKASKFVGLRKGAFHSQRCFLLPSKVDLHSPIFTYTICKPNY